jgi:hypothetical protein
MWETFWSWYERTYVLNVSLALGLFLLQLAHLVWLFGEVVWAFLTGIPLFVAEGLPKTVIVLVDYTEIPALLSVSLIYINELRKRFNIKDLLLLIFLNSQWLHLFWITDEFVETTFNEPGTILPLYLAWVAVGIDYLELPVMVDTVRKFMRAVRERRAAQFLKHELL